MSRARKEIAERLGRLAKEQGANRRELHGKLEKIEAQLARVVDFIVDGEKSQAIRDRLRTLEQEAEAARRDLASAEKIATSPVKLPTPNEMMRLVFDLQPRLLANVTRGREELRRLFRDGRIDLVPQPGGSTSPGAPSSLWSF